MKKYLLIKEVLAELHGEDMDFIFKYSNIILVIN